MQWSEAILGHINALKPINITVDLTQKILGLMDLTRLVENDTESGMATFLESTKPPFGHVAAVCVYPEFIRLATAEFISTPVKVASVINFPKGDNTLEEVLVEINQALEAGAQEVDIVFPYHRYLAGERQYAQTFVSSCKAACGESLLLKVILETGVLKDPSIIADAAFDVLAAGADFVKTSTGKSDMGATLESVATLLLVVKHMLPQLKRPIGVKVSGGVKTLEQAAQYLQLADNIMGLAWAKPETFRIGASQLMQEVLANLNPH